MHDVQIRWRALKRELGGEGLPVSRVPGQEHVSPLLTNADALQEVKQRGVYLERCAVFACQALDDRRAAKVEQAQQRIRWRCVVQLVLLQRTLLIRACFKADSMTILLGQARVYE